MTTASTGARSRRNTSGLSAHQDGNREQIVIRIEATKAEIDAEIERDGEYKQNGGTLNLKHFLERAAVGYSTLKNKSHKLTTKANLDAWIITTNDNLYRIASDNFDDNANLPVHKILEKALRELDIIKIKYEELEFERDSLRKYLSDTREELTAAKARIAMMSNSRPRPVN